MDLTPSLRPERPADEAFLVRLYASTRSEELKVVPWDDHQKDAFLRMQFDLQTLHYRRHYPAADFLIILLEERPVGRLYVDRAAGEILVLDIALLPEHRGTGIGGRLMRELISEAAAAQKPVRIHVERNNPARRLYERLGFRMVEEVGIHFLMECSPAAPATE
jgi:ribosomal protein S18 acetylase RimI-like enzyme